MLVIRLRRGGKKHEAHYRIVVQEQRSKLGGKYIESLGHYHPIMPNKPIEINKERVEYWLSSGAQLSVTANNLFVKAGILPKEQKISKVYSKKKKIVAESFAKPAKAETTAAAKEDVTEKSKEAEGTSKEEVKEESKKEETVTVEEPKEPETTAVVEDKSDIENISEISKKPDSDETVKVDEVVQKTEEKS
ncbi:MAG: 30S ribosomal protein S16 [Berkelbacteria bacterium GW2011_GWA2_38_9]|uniref:Small ribosomal subunit protein bS16 n=1 Tax=Berkelbacteria bacterium GW2011_GWA2_38_9 TaxID=1618334 RepID=A0A0G0PMV8_9BACT|nr:MAG: 30S ribosomal protein S16 [Berkelbacteria bacterium GW2011_GWA2_38_9]